MSGDNGMFEGTSMPNPYKMWENLYFNAEDSMGAVLKKMVETKGFANGIDFILNNYLQYLKFQNEIAAAYIDNTPLSSKQDTARLARLLVALENKLDRLEDDFTNELAAIKDQTNEVLEHLAVAQDSSQDQAEVSRRINNTLDDLQNVIQRVDQMETNLKTMLSGSKTEPAKKAAPAAKKSTKAAPTE